MSCYVCVHFLRLFILNQKKRNWAAYSWTVISLVQWNALGSLVPRPHPLANVREGSGKAQAFSAVFNCWTGPLDWTTMCIASWWQKLHVALCWFWWMFIIPYSVCVYMYIWSHQFVYVYTYTCNNCNIVTSVRTWDLSMSVIIWVPKGGAQGHACTHIITWGDKSRALMLLRYNWLVSQYSVPS